MINPNIKKDPSKATRVLPLTAQVPNINYASLRKVCSMGPAAIGKKYGLTYYPSKDGGYYYKDNGADILAVAHLDSVLPFTHFDFARLRQDTLIFAPNLDDRLGAYIILEMLANVKGLKYDILLTLNEENGQSTAIDFNPPKERQYNWMFMFDRVGTGCTVYNYKGVDWELALDNAGFSVHKGSYSCIASLGFLGCKGVNFGAGYHDNHSPYAMAMKSEILSQVRHFMLFYEMNFNIYYQYEEPKYSNYYESSYKTYPQQKKDQTYPLTKVEGKKLEEKDKSTIDKVLEFKKRKEKEKVDQATKLASEVAQTKWNRIQNSLLAEIGVLPVPFPTLTKLYDNNMMLVGEVARMSKAQLLNLRGVTKWDVENIHKALTDWDLDFNTNLDVYQVSITSYEDGSMEMGKGAFKYKPKEDTMIPKVQIVAIPVSYTDPDKKMKELLRKEAADSEREVLAKTQQKLPQVQLEPKTIKVSLPEKGRIKGPLSIRKKDDLVVGIVNKNYVWLAPPAGTLQPPPEDKVVGFSHLRLMEKGELVKSR